VALRPDADVTVNGWRNDSGGTTLYASLNETTSSDANYIQSSDNPTAEVFEVALSNPTGTPTNGPLKYRIFKKFNNAAVVNMKVALMQGATEIASWLHNDISSTPTEYSQTLTGPQFAAITDFTDLRIRGTANPSASWSPLDLGTEYLAWLSVKDLTKMYQTDDTSTAVTTDAQDLGRINDKSNSVFVYQGTQANRPTYRATGLGASSPSMRFDGVNDYLWTGFSNAIAVSPQDKLFFATVLKYDTTNTTQGDILLGFVDYSIGEMLTSVSSCSAIQYDPFLSGVNPGLKAVRASTSLSYILVASGTRIAIISKFDAANHTMIADGTAQTPAASTGNFGSTGDLIIGCGIESGSPSRFAQCDMGDIIMGKNLTSGNETSLIAWLLAY
jgi:hypothetical protein